MPQFRRTRGLQDFVALLRPAQVENIGEKVAQRWLDVADAQLLVPIFQLGSASQQRCGQTSTQHLGSTRAACRSEFAEVFVCTSCRCTVLVLQCGLQLVQDSRADGSSVLDHYAAYSGLVANAG